MGFFLKSGKDDAQKPFGRAIKANEEFRVGNLDVVYVRTHTSGEQKKRNLKKSGKVQVLGHRSRIRNYFLMKFKIWDQKKTKKSKFSLKILLKEQGKIKKTPKISIKIIKNPN